MRLSAVVCACLFVLSARASGADPLQPFLETHCISCHDSNSKKGNLDLTALSPDAADPKAFAHWVKVHDRVKAGEMPPKKRLGPKEIDGALALLSDRLTKADVARRGSDGRAVMRRLTRTEYEYTMQDLFALPGMPLREDLPPDGSAAGFDKVGEALDISHVQMAKYLDTAKHVIDRAVATRPQAPLAFKKRLHAPDQYEFFIGLTSGDCVLLKNKKRDPAYPLLEHLLPSDKIHYYIESVLRPSKGTVGVFRHTDDSFHPGFPHFSPVLAGRYRVRVSLWSFWWDRGEVKPSKRTQIASIRTDRGVLGHFDAPSIESKVHEVECWLEPNDTLFFNTDSLEAVHVYAQKGRAKEYQGPGIAIDWLEVEGPLHDAWPPVSHTRLFGEAPIVKFEAKKDGPPTLIRTPPPSERRRDSIYPHGIDQHGKVIGLWTVEPTDPAKLLKPFLTLAFRRPATDAQVARYAGIVAARTKAGDSFEDAMRAAYVAALCSPDFLFRVEKPGRLDDWAIATRLSYFLWNSIPDDELLDLAARGELKEGGDTLRNQVRRMLQDPRANRFVADFLGQWLALNEIASTTPDKQLYPEFKPYFENCFVGETQTFFKHLLDHNLGIANLVESDFAMLNGELGRLYGIDPVPEGHEYGRVFLPPGSHRGGLLTQASILKVTANGAITSPVKRGAWVMDRLLGLPPDPPPPNVGEVDPDLRGATTIRQQLDLHRNSPSCAGCHRTIDPPGFALESYDVMGRWRERYRAKEKGDAVNVFHGEGHYGATYKLGLTVDCTGQTADGRPFKDVEEFKKLLLRDERQLARNYVRRLATYATGREVGFADRPAIEAILDKCSTGNETELKNFGAYRMRNLLEELVLSELFLAK